MNCTKAVKILYDYDILDQVKSYLQNMNCYHVTNNENYLYEASCIKQDLNLFFDIGQFELNMLSSQKYIEQYFFNKQKVRARLRDRINLFMNKVDDFFSVYFVTLTFDDVKYCINREYKDIRRDVREFVKEYADYFILNKDYGDKNFRLHFHGVLVLYNSDIVSFKENYNKRFGFCHLQCCNTRSDLLSAYIEKLSFHALKTSTQKEYKEHVIYSRLPKEDRILLDLNKSKKQYVRKPLTQAEIRCYLAQVKNISKFY